MAVTAEPAAEPAPEQADMKEPAAEAQQAFASTSAPQSSLKGKASDSSNHPFSSTSSPTSLQNPDMPLPGYQTFIQNGQFWGAAKLDQCPVIMLPKNFQPKEGVRLTDDLVVGGHISSGLQGGVYDLLTPDGKKANMVFKIVHSHAPLAEVEREWEVGMRLNQLAEEDGSLPGFMGVGAGLRGNGRFRGMLLERLHGRPVDKVICTQKFHDVNYIHDMLYSVFLALDKAQGALGFHHSDLRLANVMEILPTEHGSKEKAEEQTNPDEHHLEENEPREGRQVTEDMDKERQRYQFKIIDYGLANFEETYAAGPDIIEEDAGSLSQSGTPQLMRQASIAPAPGCAPAFTFPMTRGDHLSRLPNTSPIEKLYRFMWRRKGDVYHLLFNLAEWVDGRVWPREDELEVLRMLDLLTHVTGVKLKAWFSDEVGEVGEVGGLQEVACLPFDRHDMPMHFLRRWNVRLLSWLNPSNPGLTAAEALTAPFFTKRTSCRSVIRGMSTRYARWTAPKRKRKVSRPSKSSAPEA